jgi:hypothetical protein
MDFDYEHGDGDRHDQGRRELVSRFVGAVFTLNVTDEAGVVGMPAEVEALRAMAYYASRLETTSPDEWLLVDFAKTTTLVVAGTQHDWRGTDTWFDLVDLWRRSRAALLDIPAVAAMVPQPRDPSDHGPRFTEVPTDVDPIEAYSLSAAEEARRAYEAGYLPDVA